MVEPNAPSSISARRADDGEHDDHPGAGQQSEDGVREDSPYDLMRTPLAAGRPFLGIGQVDREVLDRFRDIIGLGSVTGPYYRNGSAAEARDGYKRKPMFKWQASGSSARKVAARLYSMVGTAKREQFDRVFGAA